MIAVRWVSIGIVNVHCNLLIQCSLLGLADKQRLSGIRNVRVNADKQVVLILVYVVDDSQWHVYCVLVQSVPSVFDFWRSRTRLFLDANLVNRTLPLFVDLIVINWLHREVTAHSLVKLYYSTSVVVIFKTASILNYKSHNHLYMYKLNISLF